MASGEDGRGLDRVRAPDPSRLRRGDTKGKRALYSVDEEALPTPATVVRCPRCEVERPLSVAESLSLLRPPFLVDPVRRRIWSRCPTCRQRSWLRVRVGPGLPVKLPSRR